jgi:hypothetical protein
MKKITNEYNVIIGDTSINITEKEFINLISELKGNKKRISRCDTITADKGYLRGCEHFIGRNVSYQWIEYSINGTGLMLIKTIRQF